MIALVGRHCLAVIGWCLEMMIMLEMILMRVLPLLVQLLLLMAMVDCVIVVYACYRTSLAPDHPSAESKEDTY